MKQMNECTAFPVIGDWDWDNHRLEPAQQRPPEGREEIFVAIELEDDFVTRLEAATAQAAKQLLSFPD